MTTNDPQAGYEPAEEGKVTHEYELTMKVIDIGAEQRGPMFERFDFDSAMGSVDQYPDGAWVRHEDVMAKITSGELMVVKTTSLTATDVDDITWWACTECNTNVGEGIYQPKWKFCPGCGSKIVE